MTDHQYPTMIPFSPQVRVAEQLANYLTAAAELLDVDEGRLVSREARVTDDGAIMLLELRPYGGALTVDELVIVDVVGEQVRVERLTDGNLATNRYADLEENL